MLNPSIRNITGIQFPIDIVIWIGHIALYNKYVKVAPKGFQITADIKIFVGFLHPP